MQGAGGVGGLLMVRHGGQSYVPLMDGNGNVMGLQGLGGAKDGQTVARYDYDAFGNRITNTAPELGEDVCPFGFSTKLTDGETGLVYHGYRYYSPEMGRWINRDPIFEITGEHPEVMEEGPNLYGFVHNDPVNGYDYMGLKWRKASKSVQPADQTRVVWKRDSSADTLEQLAKEVKLDPQEKDRWAKPVGSGDSCSVSVPNVFIVANLMGYDKLDDAVISTFGGKLGSLFTFDGSKKRVNASSAADLHSAITNNKGNIWAFAMYAHGGDNTDNTLHSTRRGPRISSSRMVTGLLKSNGFKLSKIWAMQCFSGANGWDSVWDSLSYRKAVYYHGVNAVGIDQGNKPKK
jgi:RHS repeat-associated protein